MKDVSDFFVWVWSLVVAAAHYTYEAAKICVSLVVTLYLASYQFMMNDASFQSVPHLGKVLISALVAGIVPLIALAFLRAFIPAVIRGHLYESGLANLVGGGGSSTSTISTRPYITFSDTGIHVANIRKRSGNGWSVDLVKNGVRQNYYLTSGQAGSRSNLSAFGSQGEVDWGN